MLAQGRTPSAIPSDCISLGDICVRLSSGTQPRGPFYLRSARRPRQILPSQSTASDSEVCPCGIDAEQRDRARHRLDDQYADGGADGAAMPARHASCRQAAPRRLPAAQNRCRHWGGWCPAREMDDAGESRNCAHRCQRHEPDLAGRDAGMGGGFRIAARGLHPVAEAGRSHRASTENCVDEGRFLQGCQIRPALARSRIRWLAP